MKDHSIHSPEFYRPEPRKSSFARGWGLLALLLFLNLSAHADDVWISRRFTTSEGLAFQTVRDIVEMPDGSIWLATWGGGISRITGTDWITYNVDDGLAGDAVRTLLPIGEKGMWAGTSDGISHYDGDAWTSITPENTPGVEDGSIFCITRLADGTIWFGTSIGTIQVFKATPAPEGELAGAVGTWSVIDLPTEPGETANPVRDILQAEDGSVWVARGNDGLAHFKDGEWRLYREEHGLAGGQRSVLQASDGAIWSAGKRSVCRFDAGKWIRMSQDNRKATSIVQRPNGDLLLGTSVGMQLFHQGVWSDFVLDDEIVRPKVEAMTRMKDGSIWVGTSEGAYRIARSNWSSYTQVADGRKLQPTTFYVDGDSPPMVLDVEHRLCCFDGGVWRAAGPSLHRRTHAPQAIVSGSNRTAWIGYTESVCKYALARNRVELELALPATAKFVGLYRSSSGRVWVLCEDRVLEIVVDAFVETRLLPMLGKAPRLHCMEEGPDGSLWLGLDGGIQRVVDGAVQHFGTEVTAFQERHIHDICHGPDDRIWFCVPGSGLFCYDGTSWQNYRRSEYGLIGDDAMSAYRALDGTLWFGFGTVGVMSLRDGGWTRFTDREILMHGRVTTIGESEPGTYWLATYPEGLLRYRAAPDPPDTWITAFPEEIAPNGVGVIEFSGTDTWKETLPEDLLFSYRIVDIAKPEPDDAPWSGYIGHTTVITPRLHSGAYRFEVRAIDGDRNIDATPAVASFRVLAPFWRTPGFLLSTGFLSIVAALSLALGYSKHRNLRASEEKYRLLVDHQTDMIVKMDVEGRLVYVSPSYCKAIGNTQRELLGQSFVPLLHEDDRQRVMKALEKIHEPPYSVYVEERALTKDGWRWQGWQNTAVLDAHDKVIEIIAVGRDITLRKRAEEALRENERIYRGAIEASGTVPYHFDYSTAKYHFVGVGIEELTGYAPDEFDVDVWISIVEREILTGELRELSSEEGRRKVREEVGVIWSADYRIRHRNGKARWLSNFAVQVLNDDGEIVGSLGLLQDITDRMEADKALRESEELHRSAIEAAGAVPYYKNHVTACYEHVGPAIQSLVGVPTEEFTPEVMQKLLEEVVLLGDLANLSYSEAVECTRGPVDVAWRADYRIRTPNGESKWIGDAAVHVRNREGTVIGSLGILLEVTERRLAEENRRKLEEQLRQAQKMEAVGQLAGGIAHDFNNLLQAILGYTDMAKSAHRPEDQPYQDMEEVEKAAERAATLTTQLLAFSRRQLLQPIDLDLNEVIADLSKMLRRVIGENIELNLALGADLEIINADPGALEQVMLNFCLNARDAMPKGGQMTIDTRDVVLDEGFARQHPWAKVGKYALLSVTDNGVGIATEMLEHVFEPFFTTKDVGKGTGLGLSMVYGIVKQHDGLIHAYSELGRGTTFTVYLPSGERGEMGLDREEDIPAPEAGTETILVAEDESIVRDVAVRVLERNGYTVLVAKDGEEAVRVFEANAESIDLALLDVVMPKMSGREAYDRFIRIKPDICTLFTTGYSTSSIHSSFIIEDGLQVLQKPYSPDALLRRVREVLSAR